MSSAPKASTRRARARVAGVALVFAVAAVVPAAARHRPPPCSAARSHTALRTIQARVYWQLDSAGVREYFGCAFRYNRRYSLGIDVQQVRLAGYRVAVATAGGSFVTISVFHLPDGRARGSSDIENLPNHDQPTATDLVLKSDGAVAWIVTNVDGNLTPPGAVVGRMDSRGEATLASGNDIQARSLRLRGTALSWTQAGTRRTSTLR